MIQLTEKAVQKVKEFAEAEGMSPTIRLKVAGGGCGGFVRDMIFDENISNTDEIINQDQIKIVIDMFSAQYLNDTLIDFIETEFNCGFKFIDKNIKGSWGCGKSVSY